MTDLLNNIRTLSEPGRNLSASHFLMIGEIKYASKILEGLSTDVLLASRQRCKNILKKDPNGLNLVQTAVLTEKIKIIKEIVNSRYSQVAI